MRALYGSAPYIQRRTNNLVDAQRFRTHRRSNNIHHRIDGTHFVQMNSLRRETVNLALDRSNRGERAISQLPHARRRATLRHERADGVDVPTVRLWRNLEVDFLTDDLAANDLANLDSDALDAEGAR